VSELLSEAIDLFRAESADAHPFPESRDHCRTLAGSLLDVQFNGARTFFYHGTTLGRLDEISRDGLLPGRKPVWNRDQEIREYSETAVFLTDTWRGAVNWAQMAHLSSRGPRSGRARYPVVLRVSCANLQVEPDRVARARGCFMFRGPLPTERIELLTSIEGVPPHWERLTRGDKGRSEKSLPDFRAELS
jgi:hypothetical protein